MNNSQKISLVITGIQMEGDIRDKSEITADGEYFQKGKKKYIFYKEYVDNKAVIQNRLTITDDFVELKKTGNGNSVLRFCIDSDEACSYPSPAGMMELVSDTRKIHFIQREKSFRLELEYSLYMNSVKVSDYILTVKGETLE